MNQKQIIEELEELVEMASFSVPYEDDTEQTFRAVEVGDIKKLIDKFKNATNICHLSSFTNSLHHCTVSAYIC